MNPITAILSCYRKAFTYSGRASRPEFWYFVLWYLVFAAGIEGLQALRDTQYPNANYAIGLLIVALIYAQLVPLVAAASRRLHDSDRSTAMLAFLLLPVVGSSVILVLCAFKGTDGDNKYGPSPRGVDGARQGAPA